MKENSIKNDRSSIKEDIKDIEKYISFTSKRENFSHDTDWNWNKDLANKIEHILSDYKRVLKINEVLLKENEELKFKERSRIIGKYGDTEIHDLINRTLSNDYISVQKVKDNLIKYQEEYELLLEHQSGKESNRTKYLRGRIHMCQELLEGRK